MIELILKKRERERGYEKLEKNKKNKKHVPARD